MHSHTYSAICNRQIHLDPEPIHHIQLFHLHHLIASLHNNWRTPMQLHLARKCLRDQHWTTNILACVTSATSDFYW